MSQFDQPPKKEGQTREQKKQEYIALARELSEAHEGFSFPGINPESYSELKAVAEEFPEYSSQTDELIGRFQVQGMKVILRIDSSENAEMDNLFPRHLEVSMGMDERLRRLVVLNKELQST